MSEKLIALDHLNKIDLFLVDLDSKYPFTISQQAKYTQHEIELYYKENYCRVDSKQEEKTGGSDNIQKLTFFEY